MIPVSLLNCCLLQLHITYEYADKWMSDFWPAMHTIAMTIITITIINKEQYTQATHTKNTASFTAIFQLVQYIKSLQKNLLETAVWMPCWWATSGVKALKASCTWWQAVGWMNVHTCAAAQMTSMCCKVMQHSAARKLKMIWLCLIIYRDNGHKQQKVNQ